MNRTLLGVLVIAATSTALPGQTSTAPAPQTVIRDGAWSADAGTIIPATTAPRSRGLPRLANLSVRAQSGTGANTIIAGAGLRGDGSAPVLVRAIGPGLGRFGVTGFPRNVNLNLYRGTNLLAQTNTTGPGIASASALVGSFPLVERTATVTSSDAALAGHLAPGTFTAHCAPATGTSGIALLEFFDATAAPEADSPRFVNLSARARVEPGDGVLVVGFVVTGEGSTTVLLRGIGPSLQRFGVTGWVRDPAIELYHGGLLIAANDDWRGPDLVEVDRLEQARIAVGGFSLSSNSDASLLVTLRPGAYTLQVRGSGSETGLALAEIHEVARTLEPPPAFLQLPVTDDVHYFDVGNTSLGEWRAEIIATPSRWSPGAPFKLQAVVRFPDLFLQALGAKGINPDTFVLLVTAERLFDADGILRLPSDEKMSTLLTPTGIGIEGGIQGAVTTRYGYRFRTPIDEVAKVPAGAVQIIEGGRAVTFNVATRLPDDLPPGLYRLRLDYGVAMKTRLTNLNAETFARRGFPTGPCDVETYSPLIPASGRHASGRMVDAATIKPRIPWALLNGYNSNGYRGVVAEEDQRAFALSSRNLIQDDVILPRFSETSPTSVVSYSLEPQFPADTIYARQNLPWDFTKGELSVKITQPDGREVDLGRAPFVGRSGQWPTTRDTRFTQWRPPMYGQYTVRATGWTQDMWGNRYEGGGTYRFWIAKRMTLATATFQGQAYPVGNRYGRDMGFAPAVPAEVSVTARLFVNSDPNNVRTVSYSGRASVGGIFGAAQGMKPLNFDAPGEYLAHVVAKYLDVDGHLWVESMRHAGVIYPVDSPIVAHGKMLNVKGRLVERGETEREGWVDAAAGTSQLEHIDFPYQAGDVLLIATEGQSANKIEPVLSWAAKVNPAPYDSKIQTIGYSNVRIQTSNGYSPHLFPEYITDLQYWYAGAPRPGFMGRFIVSEDGVRAPYWQLSPQSFGGQIGASTNGDSPGEIYRLLGGVVLRNQGQAPMYAGYMANAVTLPPGSKNNRVIAPGTEDIQGPTGQKARVFLAMNARPGMVYDQGTTFVPAFQIDPMLPVNMKFTLTYPDGRQFAAQGTGDATGSWAGAAWTLDAPGVYRYAVDGEWNGYKALVPGLPADGGMMFVIEKERPVNAPKLKFNLPPISRIDPATATTFTGTSTASSIYYAAVIPGAVIGQGTIPVSGGRFTYTFDPTAVHQTTPTYDTVNSVTQRAELGDVVHFTFFSPERGSDGRTWWSFVRLIIRANMVHYAE